MKYKIAEILSVAFPDLPKNSMKAEIDKVGKRVILNAEGETYTARMNVVLKKDGQSKYRRRYKR